VRGGEQLAVACRLYSLPLEFFFFLIKMCLTGFKLHCEDGVSECYLKKGLYPQALAAWLESLDSDKNLCKLCLGFAGNGDPSDLGHLQGTSFFERLPRVLGSVPNNGKGHVSKESNLLSGCPLVDRSGPEGWEGVRSQLGSRNSPGHLLPGSKEQNQMSFTLPKAEPNRLPVRSCPGLWRVFFLLLLTHTICRKTSYYDTSTHTSNVPQIYSLCPSPRNTCTPMLVAVYSQ
jgi:hypothetical protein